VPQILIVFIPPATAKPADSSASDSYQRRWRLAKSPRRIEWSMMRRRLASAALLVILGSGAAAQESGEAMLQKCKICHTLDAGGRSTVGPNLHGLFGRKAGTTPGFQFSAAMTNSGIVWDDETLAKFLRDPKNSIPGNRMAFVGIGDDTVLSDLIARLKQAAQ
jgi:cytochrome c